MPGLFRESAELDMAILRELYRSGVVTVAGIDPRLNVSRIAHRLRCSRARIAARLDAWRDAGFLLRYEVWPNPALFGLSGGSVDVRVQDRLRKPALLERLALLDGAVGAVDVQGPWVAYQFVFPDEATRARRLRLLRHLEGVAEVGEPLLWASLPPKRPLSPLDLRLVRALRAAPAASLAEIARSVGVSPRTVATRYEALVEEWAVWFVPVFDFARLPGVVISLVLVLDAAARQEEIRRHFRTLYPQHIEFGWAGFGPVPDGSTASFFVYLPSAAAIEELERAVASWDGVLGAEANIMVRIHSFRQTFEELLPGPSPSPTGLPAGPSPERGAPTRRPGPRRRAGAPPA